MDQFNSRLKLKEMSFVKLAKGASTAVTCFLLVMLCSCSTLPDRYLFPTVPLLDMEAKERGVVFQGFSEDFLVDEEIGVHRLGNRQRKLKVMRGEMASALDALVVLGLAEKNHAVRLVDIKPWKLTVDDLAYVAAPESVILGGRIRNFRITASTVPVRVATEYEFMIEIDCYIGKVGEKKVVKRTVLLEHKMLSFSSSQSAMDKLLNKFLEEVALKVVENVTSFL